LGAGLLARRVRVAAAQMAMSESPRANLKKALDMIGEAAASGADIACLPELFMTTYFPQSPSSTPPHADSVPGEVSEALAQAASRHGIVVVAGSLCEHEAGKLYNTSFVIGRGGQFLGKYRKSHVPDDEFFYEGHYFTPGDTGYRVFEASLCRLGVLICYDQWFPEPVRILALEGAEIIFYPSAIGSVEGVEQEEGDWAEAWETVQRGHAIANSVPVVVVNRVGREGRIRFWGRSLVIDAFGAVRLRAGEEEGVYVSEIDLDHGPMIRRGWRFFEKRRPETYGRLSERG
jgi:predicted amidohydrolase